MGKIKIGYVSCSRSVSARIILIIENCKETRGSFLCDGIGLGKTFIGLMLMKDSYNLIESE